MKKLLLVFFPFLVISGASAASYSSATGVQQIQSDHAGNAEFQLQQRHKDFAFGSTATLSGLKGNEKVVVMTSAGSILQILRASADRQVIDLTRYAAGLYRVVVSTGANTVFTGKVIKE